MFSPGRDSVPANVAVPTSPGWYADRSMVNTNRYWDGQRWTENIAPSGPPAPTGKSEGKIGYVAAVCMPIIGMLIGAIYITTKDGPGVLVASIVSLFIWYLILAG